MGEAESQITENFWDTRYASEAYIFGKEPSQFVSRYAHLLAKGSEVFLPADGEGRNSVFLARLGHLVTATDHSAIGLEKARRLAEEQKVNIDFQKLNLKGLAWPHDRWDAIVNVCIQFADPLFREEIFAGLKQAVRPGGLIFLHGYTPNLINYKSGGPDRIANLYTKDLLLESFADFEIIVLKAYDRHISEGAHLGKSALIDLVARRPK